MNFFWLEFLLHVKDLEIALTWPTFLHSDQPTTGQNIFEGDIPHKQVNSLRWTHAIKISEGLLKGILQFLSIALAQFSNDFFQNNKFRSLNN